MSALYEYLYEDFDRLRKVAVKFNGGLLMQLALQPIDVPSNDFYGVHV